MYDGIPELLEQLKNNGKTLILATSKPESFAKQILEHFDLAEYFDLVVGASMDETRNKKEDVIRYALDIAGISDVKNAVMIGDREQDIIGAKINSLDSIGVLYGYGDLNEHTLAGATYIAEEVIDVLKYV